MINRFQIINQTKVFQVFLTTYPREKEKRKKKTSVGRSCTQASSYKSFHKMKNFTEDSEAASQYPLILYESEGLKTICDIFHVIIVFC